MAKLGRPCHAKDIAEAAGMKERYVREWLGAMVTGRIVEFDTSDETYVLPSHRIEVLCRQRGDGSEAVVSEAVPAICEVYSDILKCMEIDGPKGLPYSRYNLFSKWLELKEETRADFTPSKYLSEVNEVKQILGLSTLVCEIGCSSGTGLCRLATDYPNPRYYGIDISQSAIKTAKSLAETANLSNVTFSCTDTTRLQDDWEAKFDVVYCMDVVHDVPRPDILLKEIHRILKKGGFFIMVDINGHTKLADNMALPFASVNYMFSLFACMPMSLYADGWGLGSMWGQEKAFEMLTNAHFECLSISD
ncbi:S-adenosylmethionine-dependent methyltransferase Rv2258c-like [Saccoglossus kowalevskii]|uniref:Uncharacterized protein LOC100377209 n=1 Tax=Saccoglossus kowalevskii TaxID=10224 RepID=A0ABM0N0H1_SACKO|nr:PREDICTED: uncharacterized protein LOC100377209 [Saccoglossus kowalevskii]